MKFLKKIISKFTKSLSSVEKYNQQLDEIKINQGIILSNLNKNKLSKNIKDFEFKIFSQWGEDGIIQHIIDTIEIKNKTFIEFGVSDFFESNCRFLMMKDNWRGFVIDGSEQNIANLSQSYFFWKYDLTAIKEFITRENINQLLLQSGFDEDVGILSIDLDGNDYYVLEAITSYKPRILICEYNSIFGESRKVSVPYSPNFFRTDAHYSNLYWGASLSAITYLANLRGYDLVGTNSAGNNAFYVRKDLISNSLKELVMNHKFSPSKYRECRDRNGELLYLTADKAADILKGLPIYDVEKKMIEIL